ncbi:LETM1-like protein [Tanacetum coccineum]
MRVTFPGRHVAREKDPQRQVTRDTTDLSLGNMANVVVAIVRPRGFQYDHYSTSEAQNTLVHLLGMMRIEDFKNFTELGVIKALKYHTIGGHMSPMRFHSVLQSARFSSVDEDNNEQVANPILKRSWAMLLGIGPALRVVVSISMQDWAKKLVHQKTEFVDTLKLLGVDVKIGSKQAKDGGKRHLRSCVYQVTGEDDFSAVLNEMFNSRNSSSDSGIIAGDKSPTLFLAADITPLLLLVLVGVITGSLEEEEEEESAWRSNEAAEAARKPRPRGDRMNRQHGRTLTALLLLLLLDEDVVGRSVSDPAAEAAAIFILNLRSEFEKDEMGNILLDSGGLLKVADLYIAPEIYKDELFDGGVDVYSFGIILYEMMEGVQRPTFKTKSKYYPPDLKELIEECWYPNLSIRSKFSEIIIRLDKIVGYSSKKGWFKDTFKLPWK